MPGRLGLASTIFAAVGRCDMPLDPRMSAPPIPGVTRTEGTLPGEGMDAVTRLATLMGLRGVSQKPSSSPEKMAQVVQLLREIAKEDPRLAEMAGGALRALIEGPSAGQAVRPIGGPGEVAGLMPPRPAVAPLGGPMGMS